MTPPPPPLSPDTPPDQLDLFGSPAPGGPSERVRPAPAPAAVAALASRLPPGVHLGTSTWSFPGWAGIVWDGAYSETELARRGLPAYAAHPLCGGVGLDRTYYQPLSAAEYAAYAAQVPAGFRFVVKAHQDLTLARRLDKRRGKGRGRANPRFLDAAWAAEQVVAPFAEGLGEKAGPLIFQFPPQELGPPLRFIERLFGFLGALPAGPLYAVEVRNRGLLSSHLALALADAGAVPCLTVYPSMPDLRSQWRRTLGVAAPERPALVVRWNLRAGMTYTGARERYFPFDRLVDEDPERRAALAGLVRRAAGRGWPAFVTVNNKAEGSAPLSLVKLAEEIVDGGAA